MKLNQTNAYAIAAMAYIVKAPAGQVVSNTAIYKACKMPARYVTQLMRKLVVADILVSVLGITGGYKLAKPADQINRRGDRRADRPERIRDNAADVGEGEWRCRESSSSDRGGRSQAPSGGHARGLAGGEGGVRLKIPEEIAVLISSDMPTLSQTASPASRP